ncbi:NAD-dependent protein deacylase sirtuin-5, mitochondrial-like [Ptychodera flava]|uniref:NAD-dependent protein deacylase sirtuin-5, mitochondrial-like n=1 Tax=Ptychodera flava TaxID=63121 RepID=UPI00396A60C4
MFATATSNFLRRLKSLAVMAERSRPSSDMAAFREVFSKAKYIVVLTGAGISAESGIPTFRGAGGYWRRWKAQDLATPQAFGRNPSLVWEFYSYRREVVLSKMPNPGHEAIAAAQKRLAGQGRKLVVITQNIDRLHHSAGTDDVIELHGTLFKVRCTECETVREDWNSPIVPALAGKGAPDPDAEDARIPEADLPRCNQAGCGALARPHVVWFGEGLDSEVLSRVDDELEKCDLCLVVGTSSVVYPAAMFAPLVAQRGVPVAEFNLEETSATTSFGYHFSGPAGQTLPVALAPHPDEKD